MPDNVNAGYEVSSSRGLSSERLIEEVFAFQGGDEKNLGLELNNNNDDGNELGFLPHEQQQQWALHLPEDNPNAVADSCVGNVVFALDGSALAWTGSSSQVVIVPWHPVQGRVDRLDPGKWPVVINTGSEPGMGMTSMPAVTALALVRVSSCPGIRGRISPKDIMDGNNRGQHLLWTSLMGRLLAADLLLVTGHANGVIRIWNGYTGRLLAKLVDNKSKVLSLCFAPIGSLRLASAHADHTIKLWDLVDDGNMYKTLRGHSGAVYCVAWSPNGRRLASVGAGRQIRIWDLEHGHHGDTPCLKICGGHKNDIVSCQFTQDGALLATASHDTSVILWDSRTGIKVGCLYHMLPAPHLIYASGLNSCWIRDVALFPDGCHAATVCDDRKLRVWDLSQGDKPVAEKILPASARCCVVSPKGNTIVVGFGTGEVKFYRPRCLEVASLRHLARLALRKTVVPFPSQIECLPLPRTLKPYLLYHDWV